MNLPIKSLPVLVYLAVINLIGFAIMGWDKAKAKQGAWRVPEKTLMGIAAAGGGVGVLMGMRTFRHKTKHAKFTVGVPAIIIAQLALLWKFGEA